jgi:hypothetical protein
MVLAECRVRAREVMAAGKPVNRAAAVVIVAIWLIAAALTAMWLYKVFSA